MSAHALALPAVLAGGAPPAGGAALGQVIIASAIGAVLVGTLGWFVRRHRLEHRTLVGRAADWLEARTGLPAWAALPLTTLSTTLLVAVFGMYWDISIHIDKGRDPGPLANPAHYFILFGLFGVFAVGVIAAALPRGGAGPTWVRLHGDWKAPVGGLLIAACGAFSLAGFPLDDIWHRLFGQDVTLYGPTHMMMISGASLSTLAGWVLLTEARRAMGPNVSQSAGFLLRINEIALAGGFLVGLSTFQAEFDYSVPQLRLAFDVVLVMLAASIGLVTARLRLGRGGALYAVLVFLGIRGLLALLVGPVLGRTHVHFPLYIAEALLVEGVALALPRLRSVWFGVVSGVLIGTVGLAAEWGWSHVWGSFPWTGAMVPSVAPLGFVAAVAGGVLGAAIGTALGEESAPEGRSAAWLPRVLVPLAGVAAVAMLAVSIPIHDDLHTTADVSLTDVTPAPHRTVNAVVHITPASAVRNAEWFDVTAWQGGGSRIIAMVPTGQPGTYRTSRPIPVYGKWKSILRLHRGLDVLGMPVFLPADPAIPAAAVPASAHFTRHFVRDKKNLQRETKTNVAGPLTVGAYLMVLVLAIIVVGFLAWGLRRLTQRRRDSGTAYPGGRATTAKVAHSLT